MGPDPAPMISEEVMPDLHFCKRWLKYIKSRESSHAKSMTHNLLASLEQDQDAGHVVDLELANIHLDILQDIDGAYRYAKKNIEKDLRILTFARPWRRSITKEMILEGAYRTHEHGTDDKSFYERRSAERNERGIGK